VNRAARWLATALVVGAVTACSAGPAAPAGPAGPAGALPPADAARRLAGVCPATVVIQTEWEPEAETGGLYQLVGPGRVIDADHKRVSGPLVIGGRDTGVRVEVRAGGAAIGFTSVPAQMYLDRSILLGTVHTDIAIGTSRDQPVTAVFAPMAKSPEILMWDPASHPDWRGIADIGASGATVLTSKDTNTTAFLLAKGLIKPQQVDLGYTGAPARFIADPTIAQYGYATSEPYIYEHEIPEWGKPVRYQLLADLGHSTYSQALSVRSAELEPESACLTKLVPILQQAQLDYLSNPGPTDHLIYDAVVKYATSWTYSLDRARYTLATMKRLGIMANDTSGPLGGMDPVRMQSTINTYAPILAAGGAHVRPGLRAADIATNRFLDPALKLPR
jgi:hypothetical protein